MVPQTSTTTSITDIPETAWYLGGNNPDTLSVFGHGQPHNSDLPLLTSYSGTNSSIAGNSVHNPFYLGPVTFELHTNLSRTDGIGIGGVYFEFGTAPEYVAAIPEPETYAMLLAGLGLMGFVAKRRRKQEVV